MTDVGYLFGSNDRVKHSSAVSQDCQNEMLHGRKIILKQSGRFTVLEEPQPGGRQDAGAAGLSVYPSKPGLLGSHGLGRRHGIQYR